MNGYRTALRGMRARAQRHTHTVAIVSAINISFLLPAPRMCVCVRVDVCTRRAQGNAKCEAEIKSKCAVHDG